MLQAVIHHIGKTPEIITGKGSFGNKIYGCSWEICLWLPAMGPGLRQCNSNNGIQIYIKLQYCMPDPTTC